MSSEAKVRSRLKGQGGRLEALLFQGLESRIAKASGKCPKKVDWGIVLNELEKEATVLGENPPVFELLSDMGYEKPHQAMLAWLTDPAAHSDRLPQIIVSKLLGQPEQDLPELVAVREYPLRGRPADLVWLNRNTGQPLALVEMKVRSPPGWKQPQHLANVMQSLNKSSRCIWLGPHPPKSERWTNVSWARFEELLKEACDRTKRGPADLACQFQTYLSGRWALEQRIGKMPKWVCAIARMMVTEVQDTIEGLVGDEEAKFNKFNSQNMRRTVRNKSGEEMIELDAFGSIVFYKKSLSGRPAPGFHHFKNWDRYVLLGASEWQSEYPPKSDYLRQRWKKFKDDTGWG